MRNPLARLARASVPLLLLLAAACGGDADSATSRTRLLGVDAAGAVILAPGSGSVRVAGLTRVAVLGAGRFAGLEGSTRNVWEYDAEGAKVASLGQLGEKAAAAPLSFSVSPDGTRYTWVDGDGLWLGSFDGSAATVLDAEAGQPNGAPARFSAGGEWLVYAPNAGGSGSVRRLRLGGTVEVLRAFAADTERVAIARDGTVFTGDGGTELSKFPPGTTTPVSLPLPVAPYPHLQITAHQPVLSLDERRLVFWSDHTPEANSGGFSYLYSITVDGTELTYLGGTSAINEGGRLGGTYTPSADGLTSFLLVEPNATPGRTVLERSGLEGSRAFFDVPPVTYATLQ